MALNLCVSTQLSAGTISGKVTDADGKAMEGVMLSAFDEEQEVSISVFSQADGTYRIDGLRDTEFNVRARLLGQPRESNSMRKATFAAECELETVPYENEAHRAVERADGGNAPDRNFILLIDHLVDAFVVKLVN